MGKKEMYLRDLFDKLKDKFYVPFIICVAMVVGTLVVHIGMRISIGLYC